jgi:hypothetical protein
MSCIFINWVKLKSCWRSNQFPNNTQMFELKEVLKNKYLKHISETKEWNSEKKFFVFGKNWKKNRIKNPQFWKPVDINFHWTFPFTSIFQFWKKRKEKRYQTSFKMEKSHKICKSKEKYKFKVSIDTIVKFLYLTLWIFCSIFQKF